MRYDKEDHGINIFQSLLFEVKSFLGRISRLKSLRLNSGNNYLHLGCAGNIVAGYINADFFCCFRPWKKHARRPDWMLDLRYPLNCDDAVFAGVFTEHTIEHLYPQQAEKLLSEIRRIMKTGAVLRITVPDIGKYVDYYRGQVGEIVRLEFEKKFKTPCAAIRSISQNYQHLSLWDYNELKMILESVGFQAVKRMSHGVSQDPKLLLDSSDRKWETLYVEAIK